MSKGEKKRITQNSHHNVIPENFNWPTRDEIECSQYISIVNQCVPWWGMGSLELHGQGPQASFGGTAEGFAVLKQGAVEVQAYICLEALWESFQHL